MLPINHLKRTLDRCCGQWEFASYPKPDSFLVRFLNTGWDNEPQPTHKLPDGFTRYDGSGKPNLPNDTEVEFCLRDDEGKPTDVTTVGGLGWSWDDEDYSPVEPLQLREGGWYRRGDNKVVGPCKPRSYGNYPWSVGGYWYTNNGKWHTDLADLHLIAEVQPPTPEPEQNTDSPLYASGAGIWFQLQSVIADQSEWSQTTFGSDKERGPTGALKHMLREAQECIDNSLDIEERADVFLLLLDAQRRSGWTFGDLVNAAEAKMKKNKARQWPKPTSDEPVEHVKPPEPEQFKAGDWVVCVDAEFARAWFIDQSPRQVKEANETYLSFCGAVWLTHRKFRRANAAEIAAYKEAQEPSKRISAISCNHMDHCECVARMWVGKCPHAKTDYTKLAEDIAEKCKEIDAMGIRFPQPAKSDADSWIEWKGGCFYRDWRMQ